MSVAINIVPALEPLIVVVPELEETKANLGKRLTALGFSGMDVSKESALFNALKKYKDYTILNLFRGNHWANMQSARTYSGSIPDKALHEIDKFEMPNDKYLCEFLYGNYERVIKILDSDEAVVPTVDQTVRDSSEMMSIVTFSEYQNGIYRNICYGACILIDNNHAILITSWIR